MSILGLLLAGWLRSRRREGAATLSDVPSPPQASASVADGQGTELSRLSAALKQPTATQPGEVPS